MDGLGEALPSVERVEVDPAQLARYTREWDFMGLASELLKEAASYVCVAACAMGATPSWSRDQAALGGNMVRLFKLLSAFADQIVQRRYETSTIVSRLIFETIVNVRYLAANFSPDLVDSYIRHSLRHERRLSDTINANIAKRGGDVLPIERRMLNSIERTERMAGVSLQSIDLKDRTPWGGKNLREKAKAVDLDGAYDAVFGGMSHNVHGAWQDLYQFHLETDGNGGFTPKLDWSRPRPQPVFVLGLLSVEAVLDFLYFIGPESAVGQVQHDLEDLTSRIHLANDAHEAYLSKKSWPAI